MEAYTSNTTPAPVSVAERIAALQKGKDIMSTYNYKPSAAHKLHTAAAARPSTKVPNRTNALADRIAVFQDTAEIAGEYSSRLNYISVKTKPSSSIQTTSTDDDIRDSDARTADIMTKSSSTFTKTHRPPNSNPPPAKPNTILMASRISALQRTINPESRSKSAHPSRNMTTSIQSSMSRRATQPRRPSVLQNTKVMESSTIPVPDHLSPVRELMMTGKTAADGVTVTKSCQVHIVTPPKPMRQSPILKDVGVSNRVTNKDNDKKSVNLPTKPNTKLSQEAHHGQSMEDNTKEEKENTQVETSFTGVSDVDDSDMITLPASNNTKAMMNSSYDTASTWNYEKTINGWQSFYTNFSLPPPDVMLESQITTPVTSNTCRNNNSNINSDVDNEVIGRKNERKGSRNGKKNNVISPSHRNHSRKVTSETDENDDDFDTVDSNEDVDLNGCLVFDEIWSAFSSLSSAL